MPRRLITKRGEILFSDYCNYCIPFWKDWYMVKDEVWQEAGFEPDDIACLTCLEEFLKRPLGLEDFAPCKINRLAFASHGYLKQLEKEIERNEKHPDE